jgi:hypothetical protein
VATAAAAAAAMLKKILNMRKVLQRLTSPADIAKTLALCGDLYKYVNSWGCDIWTICFVNFNLRRSCKLGLRRMCFRYEFIVGM